MILTKLQQQIVEAAGRPWPELLAEAIAEGRTLKGAAAYLSAFSSEPVHFTTVGQWLDAAKLKIERSARVVPAEEAVPA